jgi:hypothetical protein
MTTTPSGRVLTVGAGQQFSTLNAALTASQDGDTIAVAAGTYTNDISTVTHSVTIAGVGGLAHFQSTGLIANGKAILIDDAANLTIENLEFSGAQVADANGAGIRYETGNLTIKNSYFHDNQDGLLGSSSIAGGHVTIDGSTFTHNGAGDGQTHGLYIGQIASLTVTNSFFQDQLAGQDVKSRAAVNLIDHNRFIDTDTSANATNYQIDLPNGGNDTVSNNTVLKADNPNNYAIVHFGGEVANPVGSLLIEGNNFYSQANPSVVLTNQSLGQPIQILNNGIDLTNLNPIINGSTATATVSGTSALDTATSAPATSLVVPTALDTGITLTGEPASSGTSGRTLTVGAGQQFSTLNAAIAAAQDGDTIAVQAGTYTNDFSTITHAVTIMGVGGLAHFQASGLIPNGKAILIDDAANLTIQNMEFSGAQVDDGNGAGIRYETGNLVVKNSYFHDDQDGILSSGSIAGASATIDGSTFFHDGAGDGQTHALYMGHISHLTVTNSFFQDMYDGSDVKSRAAVTDVENNRFIDHYNFTTNYLVDLPEGGNDTVAGNVMLKSAYADNSAIIHFGGEIPNPIGTLLAENNQFYGERDPTNALLNQSTGQSILFLNNGMTPTTMYNYIAGNSAGVTVSGSTTIDINAAPDPTLVIPTVSTGTAPPSPPAPPPNQPPVTTVPGNQSVVDGSRLALSSISIADGDGATESFTVTLTAVDGTVSTSAGAGTIAGNGSGALTLSGSLANVNADLAALSFTGTAIGAGSLAIATSDGNGGSDSHTIGITVTSPADQAPVTAVPGNQSVVDQSLLALAGISIADADGAGQSFTVTLTGTDGTVSTGGGAGTIAGNGTANLILSGSLANVNADLAHLSFKGAAIGAGSLKIVTSDGAGGSDSHTIGINVTDAAPVNAVPGSQSLLNGSSLALPGIAISDADGASQTFSVTLTGTDGTVSTTGGLGAISGNGTGSLVLSGSLANVNADLAHLSFKGTAVGAGSLKIVTSDGAGGSDSDTIAINVTAPQPHTLMVGAHQTYSTIAAALNASHDGDTIVLTAGTYSTGVLMVNHAVTIDGSNGAAHIVAKPGSVSNDGALITTNNTVTLQNLDIANAVSSKHTAVAIRGIAGNLTLSDVSVHNSDSAVYDFVTGSTVSIGGSDFGHNGGGSKPVINIGGIGELDFYGNKIHDTVGVTELRSLAGFSDLHGDQYIDGTGSPVYAVDVPNVGNVIIGASTFSRSAGALNSSFIHLGGGIANPAGYLNVHDSTFVSTGSGTHVLDNETQWTSVGFQNDGIGANITQIAIGPGPAIANDYVIN